MPQYQRQPAPHHIGNPSWNRFDDLSPPDARKAEAMVAVCGDHGQDLPYTQFTRSSAESAMSHYRQAPTSMILSPVSTAQPGLHLHLPSSLPPPPPEVHTYILPWLVVSTRFLFWIMLPVHLCMCIEHRVGSIRLLQLICLFMQRHGANRRSANQYAKTSYKTLPHQWLRTTLA